jgi:Protein of unknown function (DUF1573)
MSAVMKPIILTLVLVVAICGVAWLGVFSGGTPAASATGIGADLPSRVTPAPAPAGPGKADKTNAPTVSAEGPYPAFVAPDRDFQFGRMELLEEREHKFVIRNEGEAVLKLATGASTCQCTLFELESETVPPGESTHLTVRWKPKSRNDNFRHGGPVYTNDPENLDIQFSVEGAVDAPIIIRPEQVWDAGSVYTNRPGKMTVTVGSRIYDDFEITAIDTGSEFVTTSVRPLTDQMLKSDSYRGGFLINVEVSSAIPSGRFSTDVKLDVTRAKAPLVATLMAVKRGTIQVLPAPGTLYDPEEMLVHFGQFKASKGRTVKLQLIVNEEGMTEPFQLTDYLAEPSFLDAAIEPISKTTNNVGRYWLILKIAAGKPRTNFANQNRGVLELNTNHPTDKQVILALEMSSF